VDLLAVHVSRSTVELRVLVMMIILVMDYCVQIVASMNAATTVGRHALSTRFTAIVRIGVVDYPDNRSVSGCGTPESDAIGCTGQLDDGRRTPESSAAKTYGYDCWHDVPSVSELTTL
jgi:hypothetical protein